MREILFRGQTRKKGEKVRLDGSPIDSNWVYGGIFPNNKGGDFAIIYQQEPTIEKFTVYADTVGQYTGLTDKNGKKIFEGDILRFAYNEEDKDPKIYSVEWKSDRACFGYAETADKMLEIDTFHCEVIGNIHDNPEVSGGE